MASIKQSTLLMMDSLPQLPAFDKYKHGDIVYTISHFNTKICGRDVSYPTGVNKMYINRIAYSLADSAEAFTPSYNSVNLYLYLDLIATDTSYAEELFNSSSSDNWLVTPRETVVVELFYHILPKADYIIPKFDSAHFQNDLLDERKLCIVKEVKDKTKTDIIWTSKEDAEAEVGRQSNAAARAMLELLEIGAKYIKQSERNLKDMTLEHMKGTEFLKNFVESKCTPDFEASIRKTDEWLALSLKGLLYNEQRDSSI